MGRRGGKGPPAPRASIVPLDDSAAIIIAAYSSSFWLYLSFYLEPVGLRPPPCVGGKCDRIFELWRLYYWLLFGLFAFEFESVMVDPPPPIDLRECWRLTY